MLGESYKSLRYKGLRVSRQKLTSFCRKTYEKRLIHQQLRACDE